MRVVVLSLSPNFVGLAPLLLSCMLNDPNISQLQRYKWKKSECHFGFLPSTGIFMLHWQVRKQSFVKTVVLICKQQRSTTSMLQCFTDSSPGSCITTLALPPPPLPPMYRTCNAYCWPHTQFAQNNACILVKCKRCFLERKRERERGGSLPLLWIMLLVRLFVCNLLTIKLIL